MKALELADYIINTSPKDLSNLELQKTMYFVELDYCKQTGKSLIDEDFEAWDYGPVVPEVYREFRDYGAESIDRTSKISIPKDIKKDIVDSSIERCSQKRPWELVSESHRSDGAWQKTIDADLIIIHKDLIAEEANKHGQ